jgi:hypothetical protein
MAASSSPPAEDRGENAAAHTPSRPPLEADNTPIGRDWVEWAKHLEAANDYLRLALWACFAQAGGDTDGDEKPHMNDDSLISAAVEAVKSLREDYDEVIT